MKRHVFRTCKSNRAARLRANDCGCGCGGECGSKKKQRSSRQKSVGFYIQLRGNEFRFENFEGRRHIVVPVVMARSDVPMNGGLIPPEELVPFAWNGVPVTVGHPERNGSHIEANSPEVLQEWAVGRIFNAYLDGVKLKAEAWIDVQKAEKVHPGLLKMLQSGAKIDVSTGYFCDAEPAAGRVNGRAYQELHRNLRPEHLALLPNEEGACNFADGCGVRTNSQQRRKVAMKLNAALKAFREATDSLEKAVSKLALDSGAPAKSKRVQAKAKPKAKNNERGDDDDVRQMVADLISSDDSPFLPEDEDSLRMMSIDTLKKMRDKFLGAEEDEETETAEEDEDEAKTAEDEDEAETNEDDEEAETAEDDEEEENPAMAKRKNSAEGALAAQVAKLTKLVGKLAKNSANPALSEEDRAALEEARKIRNERREQLIQHIVANTSLPEKKVRGFDYATLETLAGGVLPAPNFSGRPLPRKENSGKDGKDPAVEAMTQFTGNDAVIHALNAQRGKKSS